MNTMRRTMRGRGGFTLVELMVVILLMAVLGGIVLGVTGYAARKGARARAFADIEHIKNALEQYRMDYGGYPALSGDMTTDTPAWKDMREALTNYNAEIVFTDPWGRSYIFESQGRYQFRLWSYGPDPNNYETRVEQQ